MQRARISIVSVGTAVMLGIAAYGQLLRMQERAAIERQAELDCLARNVYYEARGEPLAGQYAVAEVTMNRVHSPLFPNSVCAVVRAGRTDTETGQRIAAFSWTATDSRVPPYGFEWRRAKAVAGTIYESREAPLVDGALFYHATYVTPEWSGSKVRVARIGRHLFYQ